MKNRVLTITPNPALDLSGTVKDLKPNEKSYVFNELKSPGGNALNAARILNRLRVPVLATGFLGGSTGTEIREFLDVEKLQHQFVEIRDTTRINVTISNQSNHQQTRLSFPGPNIKKTEKDNLCHLVQSEPSCSLMILGGSLPHGFIPQDVIRLASLAKKKGMATVIDCPGSILAQILRAKPLLIKPNLEEFQELTNCRAHTIGSIIKKALGMLNDVPMICVSSVEGGALLVTRNGVSFGRTPKIHLQSTVGAGDSMVGAMVAQIYRGQKSNEEILRWGLAAAAATLSKPGTSLGSRLDILNLYKKTRVIKIQ